MITKTNMAVAARVHALLAQKGLVLSPVDNTPLFTLVNDSMPTVTGEGDEQTTLLRAVSETDPRGVQTHDLALDEITDVIAPGIINQVKFAKDVVKASVAAVFGELETYLSESKPKNLELVPVTLSSAVNSQAAVQLYENYQGQPMRQLVVLRGLPEVTDEDAANMLKTGVSTFDQDMLDLIASKSSGNCKAVHDKYIVNAGIQGATLPTDFTRADDYLMVLLMLMHYQDNVPEGVEMTLMEYKAAVSSNIQSFAIALSNSVEQFWVNIRGKRLIHDMGAIPEYISADDTIQVEVYGPTMDTYLKEGGSPEAVFGAAILITRGTRVDQPVDYMLPSIQVQTEKLVAVYNEWWSTAVRLHAENRTKLIRTYLVPALCKQAMAVPAENRAKEFVDDTALVNAVKQMVAGISDELIGTRPDKAILSVLSGTVYSHTNSGEILSRMAAYGEKYDNLQPRDAMYLVTRDLLVDWAFSMVHVQAG